MPSLNEIRQKYPQYNDMNDQEFADKFHAKFYSDMPKEEFYSKLGVQQAEMNPAEQTQQTQISDQQQPIDHTALFKPMMMGPTTALQMGGAETYKNPTARKAMELELTSLIPPARFAKFLPQMGRVGETALNYGTDILQNAGIMGGLNAIEGESPVQGAIAGGATTAAMNPLLQSLTSSNPMLRIGAAGLLGGAGAYGLGKATGTENTYTDLAGALIGAGLASKGKNGKDLALHNLSKHVQPNEGLDKIQAAERLGLKYVTPAEATGNPITAAMEGRAGRTPEGSRHLLSEANERLESERGAIDNFLNTIGTPKTIKEAQLLYQEAHQAFVSPEFVQKLKDNSIIDQAFKNVNKDKTYKSELKGVPETSFKFLDLVKRNLDDAAQTAKRTGEKNKARLINAQIKNMTNEMDAINPVYKEARKLAERNIIKEQIKSKIPNDEEIRGSDFYRTFLANQHKYNKLHKSLRNVPEAQQQLADMKLAFKDLVNPTSVRTAKGMAEKSTSSRRVISEVLKDYMHQLQGGHYDMEAVKLLTNPKWHEELAKMPFSNDDKSRLIANILSRGTALPLGNM